MTHSSLIPVSPDLETAFARARTEGSVRFLQVSIEDETLVCTHTERGSDDIRRDFRSLQDRMQPKTPTYIIFRLEGDKWLLISYVPDGSPVKQRMLYASTRDVLKKQLGKNYFSLDMYGSSKEEFTWEAYEDSLKKPAASSAALTAAEIQYANEASAEVDPGHSREYVHSVRFPLSNAAESALRNFSDSQNFVQLSVDPVRETVELVAAKHVDPAHLAEHLSDSEPRFTFFKYKHTWSGARCDNNVFIYSCPESAPIKLKMLYSTVKSVVSGAAEAAGLSVEKNGKLEVDSPSELTTDLLNLYLHPQTEVAKPFARPARPGKGRPRLTPSGRDK